MTYLPHFLALILTFLCFTVINTVCENRRVDRRARESRNREEIDHCETMIEAIERDIADERRNVALAATEANKAYHTEMIRIEQDKLERYRERIKRAQ